MMLSKSILKVLYSPHPSPSPAIGRGGIYSQRWKEIMSHSANSKPVINILQNSTVTPPLDQAIRNGLVECYPKNSDFFSTQRSWHSEPEWIVCATTPDGKVAAHLAAVERRVLVGDAVVPVNVAGIQSVFACAPWRKTGLINSVMEKAIEESGRRSLDAGLLFCYQALADKVYSLLGWVQLDVTVFMTNGSGERVPLPGKNVAMVMPVCMKEFPAGDIDLCGWDW